MHFYRTDFYWTTNRKVNKAERVLEIQDYEYSGSVEEAWAATLAKRSKVPIPSWWLSELLPSAAFSALDIVS